MKKKKQDVFALKVKSKSDMKTDIFVSVLCQCLKSLSHVWLFAIPWTVAHQAPTSMGFSRQEYWSGLPFPSPGDLPKPGIEPRSPTLQADALTSEPPGKPKTPINRWKPPTKSFFCFHMEGNFWIIHLTVYKWAWRSKNKFGRNIFYPGV